MAVTQFESVKHIFKANDIRGLLEEVTPELARAVGYAVVRKTQAKSVLIGRDMRETSPALLQALIEGVNAAGARTVNIDLCTTSLFNYAVVTSEDVDAGIMVTASHNPAQYNGIKMAHHSGLPISGIEIYELLEDVDAAFSEIASQNENRDILERYVRHYIDVAGLKEGDCAGMQVAVDFGNGMGSLTIKRVLELLGAETHYLYDVPDARFPNHEANPAKRETLKDLQVLVAKVGADIGIATDGDADRIGFMDSNGRIMRGDQTLGLFAEILSKEKQISHVVVAPNFGWDALDAISGTGAEFVWERIGRTFVVRVMREKNVALGGELSSHFFFKDTYELESVDYALMLILKGLKESGGTFVQTTDHLHRYINSGEINFHVEDKNVAIARVKSELRELATNVNELDGLRCEFNKDWWFIVRPSNTEPLLRLTVEAKNKELLEEKIALLEGIIGGERE